MRIAWIIAWRMTGSPVFATARPRKSPKSRSSSSPARSITRPVSIRAQVEALTKSDSLLPRWPCQSASAILSRIRRSAVSASGTRSRLSARHMRTTPSLFDSPYSLRKASSPPSPWRISRTRRTRAAARSCTRPCASASRLASGKWATTQAVSSAPCAASIANRLGSVCGKSPTNVMGRLRIGLPSHRARLGHIRTRGEDFAGRGRPRQSGSRLIGIALLRGSASGPRTRASSNGSTLFCLWEFGTLDEKAPQMATSGQVER